MVSELISKKEILFVFIVFIVVLRSAYLNLILSALYNLTQLAKLQSQQELQLQTYETYNLDVKTVIDEFQLNHNLWFKNEVKLKELFILNYD